MHRAKVYLAIVAYITLVRRLFSKPLVKFLRRIRRKYRLLITLFKSNTISYSIPTSTRIILFCNPINIGLQSGFLVQFLRI